MRFKVKGHPTWYQVANVDPQDAIDHGCPKATATLTGRHETTYGWFDNQREQTVKVPATSGVYGLRCDFVADDGSGVPLVIDGYLVVD